MLMESGVINDKQPEEGNGPIRPKFDGDAIISAISKSGSFDENYMTYVDFLDALIRISYIYPFTEQERSSIVSMDQKLNFIIDRLNEKYGGYVSTYIETVANRIEVGGYQPKQVVDDEELDDNYDDS
jgi:hypothetical protein